MKLYQLKAIGLSDLTGEQSSISSKKIFVSIEKAEKYKKEFEELCTTPIHEKDVAFLYTVTNIVILELELDLNLDN